MRKLFIPNDTSAVAMGSNLVQIIRGIDKKQKS